MSDVENKNSLSIANYQWLMAFLLPYGVAAIGVLISKKAVFSLEQRALWSMLVNTAIILVVLGVMRLCRLQLADLGVRWQGLRPGLLAAGLVFVFMAMPELYAAYPWRWRSLDVSKAYDAAKYLSVGVAEELWMRGLVYTTLERRWGQRVAIVGSSLAFGLAHLRYNPVRIQSNSEEGET